MGNLASVTKRRKASQPPTKNDGTTGGSEKSKAECTTLALGLDGFETSTIMKQMKIAHQGGFSVKERVAYRVAIYQNLLENARAIAFTLNKLSIKPVDLQTRASVEHIASYELDLSIDSEFCFPRQLASSISQLWRDPTIPQIVIRHRSDFELTDNASYLFTEAERIGSPGYIPHETDILMCRQKTTGTVEARFNMGPLRIRMVEGLWQRSESVERLHRFGSVTSIIFYTSLSEYDQGHVLESLELFESVVNSQWFSQTSIILFMTKIDAFRKKLPKVPLEQYFPDYTGGSDPNKAAKYILFKFMHANRARLSVYPHLAQATDSSNVYLVRAAVKETIMQNALKASGRL